MELLDHLGAFWSDFIDPKKRLFLGYVALSVVIGFL